MTVISVDLNTEAQTRDEFLTKEAALFVRHFRALQRQTGSIVPPRKSFTPYSARAFLPYVSMMDFKDPSVALVRLVGTAIVSRTHIDNTGRNMYDLMPPEMRAEAMIGFRELLSTPCGAVYVSDELYRNGPIPIEVVSFPFADEYGKAVFIISLSVEIDRQELMLRGDERMELSTVFGKRLIDIGAGSPPA